MGEGNPCMRFLPTARTNPMAKLLLWWLDQVDLDITQKICVNYNDLRPNPGSMVNKGNHLQMALIQVNEIL